MMGFVTSKYNEHCWLEFVLATNKETQEIKVSFLHPHGALPPAYKYPAVFDILQVRIVNVLIKVDPDTIINTETMELIIK